MIIQTYACDVCGTIANGRAIGGIPEGWRMVVIPTGEGDAVKYVGDACSKECCAAHPMTVLAQARMAKKGTRK